jgi:1-acyl-sn-glycerol-3-phosphate acyltransferase
MKKRRPFRFIVNAIVRELTNLLFKVDADDLKRIPLEGPIIIIVNHVNFLELPMIYPRIRSNLGIGFSKEENWDNIVYRLLFNFWELIPISRDEIDITALRRGLEALKNNRILFITPEGTRSHDGQLLRGKPGAAWIAQKSAVPVWPIACYGGEDFKEDLSKLRRTDYHIRVGEPFRVKVTDQRVTSEIRQEIVDEMMYQIAALLPPQYRGEYANLEEASEKYLTFSEPHHSHLKQAQDQARGRRKREGSYAQTAEA